MAKLPKRQSRARSSESTKNTPSGGVTPLEAPPEVTLEVLLTSSNRSKCISSSSSSTNQVGGKVQAMQDKQDEHLHLSYLKAEEQKARSATQAEKLAANWWKIQGEKPDQIQFVSSWKDKFDNLLSIHDDLEECIYWEWYRDKFWGCLGDNPGMKLRYESEGDSMDYLEAKLNLPGEDNRSLWHNFLSVKDRYQKKHKKLPVFPEELPVIPDPPSVVPKPKPVKPAPPAPPSPPKAYVRQPGDIIIDEFD
jgi:hypothetical protein